MQTKADLESSINTLTTESSQLHDEINQTEDRLKGFNFYLKQQWFNEYLDYLGNIRVFCRVRPITQEDIRREREIIEEKKHQFEERQTIMNRQTVKPQTLGAKNTLRAQSLLKNKLNNPLSKQVAQFKPNQLNRAHSPCPDTQPVSRGTILERMTLSNLESQQSSIQIEGESKLSLVYQDPITQIQGQISGLSQELKSSRIDPKHFQFDKVFGADKTQADIFHEVKDVVRSVIDGQKVCIFAYGQTGAGKTYTMSGQFDDNEHKGIIPRAMELIFDTLNKYKMDGVLSSDSIVTMSCIELHCETLQDLLDPNNRTNQIIQNGKKFMPV